MKRSIDMTQGPLFTSMISYTIPIILTSLLQLLFNAADMIVVGRFCGSISVAAVSTTGALTNLIINLFIGLSVGVGVSVAHALGSKQHVIVHRIVHTAIPTALIGGIFLTLVGVLFSDDFLKMMETPENVLPLSTIYMRIYFCGMTFNLVYNFSASILRAAGDTKSPLIHLTFSGIVNVVLNVFFVTVFHMNVAGVALATAISQFISAILVVRTLIKRTDACKLQLKKLKFYPPQLLKIIKIGLPAGIQSSLFSISNVIIQSSINSFGSSAIISGNGASGNIEGFIYVIMNSFHQTAVNYVGQNLGAHRFDRIKKIVLYCLIDVTVCGIVFGPLARFFGESLLALYITDSLEAIQYGLIRLTYMAIPYFICGIMDVSTGGLRGLGASITPMIVTILGACVFRIVWVYTIFQIPAYHTLESLYLSYPLSWALTFLVQIILFIFIFRHKRKLEQKKISLITNEGV